MVTKISTHTATTIITTLFLITSFVVITALNLSIFNNFCHADKIITGDEHESFKAIRILHTKLDSDNDGEVDDYESQKFLEARGTNNKNNNGYKLKYLHQDGNDPSISVEDLWSAWKGSKVFAWSTEETIDWLVNFVELPQYSDLFSKNCINGTLLPKLAVDPHFISKLGIVDAADKSKISIKAMDVVLFGPPKVVTNKFRDLVAYAMSLIAFVMLYTTYSRLKASQQRLNLMQSKLDSIQKAEDQMSELQHELDKAIKAQEAVATEKRNLEHQLEIHRQNSASNMMNSSLSSFDAEFDGDKQLKKSDEVDDKKSELVEHIAKLEGELRIVKDELKETANAKKFRAPFQLRQLLQTTYNIESQHFNERKLNLESKAAEIKLRNQKLQKKKTSFLGYYKMAQENSIEEDLNTIAEIKEAIMKVTQDIRDRIERWRSIEDLCGCALDLQLSTRLASVSLKK